MTKEQPEELCGPLAYRFILLFELEYIAVDARKAAFDTLSGLLKEHKVELTPVQFSRYCLHPAPDYYMAELLDVLGAKKLSAEKLAEDVVGGVSMYLSSKEAVLNPGFKNVLDAVMNKGDIAVGALSALGEPQAEALMKKIGLDEEIIDLFAYGCEDHVFPEADTWMKIAKVMSKSPRQCVALASSQTSCKSALSAGTRCIAVPDAFTSFQDFGGVDAVVDSYDEVNIGELLEELFPAPVETG